MLSALWALLHLWWLLSKATSADWTRAFWGTSEPRIKRKLLRGKTGSISRLPAENCVDLHLIRGYLLIAPHLTNDFLQWLSVHITRVTFPPLLLPPSSLFVAKCHIQLSEWRCHSAALATGIISVHVDRKPAACKEKPTLITAWRYKISNTASILLHPSPLSNHYSMKRSLSVKEEHKWLLWDHLLGSISLCLRDVAVLQTWNTMWEMMES